MSTGNSRTADKFVLRMPDGMRDQVAELAKKNHRSMNSEIIERLERSIAGGHEVATVSINAIDLSPSDREDLLALFGAVKQGGSHAGK